MFSHAYMLVSLSRTMFYLIIWKQSHALLGDIFLKKKNTAFTARIVFPRQLSTIFLK